MRAADRGGGARHTHQRMTTPYYQNDLVTQYHGDSLEVLCDLESDRVRLPVVLDVCCSLRAFWFTPKDERALFVDKRREQVTLRWSDRHPVIRSIDPDIQSDFTALPLLSNSFWLVVFDPPHMIRDEARGNITKQYGCLNGDWREMLRRGFAECFRVLKPHGTLIFKWTETEIPLRDILSLTPESPLFGHRSGAKARTHWVAFMKREEA